MQTFAYMYIDLHTFTVHAFTNMCIHLHTCTYLHTFTYMYIHLHTFTYIHTHLHTFIYIYIHLPTFTYTFTYIYIHLQSHLHTTHTYSHYTYIEVHPHTSVPVTNRSCRVPVVAICQETLAAQALQKEGWKSRLRTVYWGFLKWGIPPIKVIESGIRWWISWFWGYPIIRQTFILGNDSTVYPQNLLYILLGFFPVLCSLVVVKSM